MPFEEVDLQYIIIILMDMTYMGGRRCNDRPTAQILKIMLPKSLDCDSA